MAVVNLALLAAFAAHALVAEGVRTRSRGSLESDQDIVPIIQRRKPFVGINASSIAAIMCIGDSWMSGLNAAQFKHAWQVSAVAGDYRGGAWACGNGEVLPGPPPLRVETLGTLLRRANPQLKGLSSGVTRMHSPCFGLGGKHNCSLNLATDGAVIGGEYTKQLLASKSRHLQSLARSTLVAQAAALARRIKKERPAWAHQWKVVTVLALWGDQWWSERSLPKMRDGVRQLLGRLRGDMAGMTYVNLLAVGDHPSSISRLQASDTWCATEMVLWKAKVRLMTGMPFNDPATGDPFAAQVNRLLVQLAEEFDDGISFVVRFQPLLRGFTFQKRLGDPFTCFHPTLELTAELAWGLLQNMQAAEGEGIETLAIYESDSAPDDPRIARLKRSHINELILL